MTNLRRLLTLITCYCSLLLMTGCEKDGGAHRFSGRLVDRTSDTPLPNVWLRIYGVHIGSHDTNGPTTSVQTNADGQFDVSFAEWSPATYYAIVANDPREPDWRPGITDQEWDIGVSKIPEDGHYDFGTVRYLEAFERLTITLENVPPATMADSVQLIVRRATNPPITPPLHYWAYTSWQLKEPFYDTQVLTGDLIQVHNSFRGQGPIIRGGAGTVTRTYWAPCGVELNIEFWAINRRPAGTPFINQRLIVVRGSPATLSLTY